MKKFLPTIAILLGIFLFLNRKNEDVLEDDTSSVNKKHEQTNKLISTKKTAQIKSDGLKKKKDFVLQETTFDDIAPEKVRYLQRDCGEYFYENLTPQDYVDNYKNMFLSTRNLKPSKRQLNAVLNIAKNCDLYSKFKNEIADTIYNNSSSQFEKEALLTVKKNGKLAGFKYLESHLFDKDMSIRLSAAKLLRDKDWISSLNNMAVHYFPVSRVRFSRFENLMV